MTEDTQHNTSALSSLKQSNVLKYIVILNLITFLAMVAGVVFSNQHIFPFYDPEGIYPFLPGDMLFDCLWLYVISVVVGGIIYLFTPVLSVVFLKLHRRFKGGYRYHLQAQATSEDGSVIKRLVVPALTSLGLAVSIAGSTFASSIFVYRNFENLENPVPAIEATFPIFFILLLVVTVILILFAPIWLLGDVGVICEKEHVDSRSTVNIEGVGDYYLKLLKGFAGVSTIVTYGLLIFQMFGWYNSMMQVENLPFPVVIFIIPVIIALLGPIIAMGPLSLIQGFYEAGLVRNKSKLESILMKAGYTRRSIEMVPTT